MATLHGVELPAWVQADGADGGSVVLPDGTRLGFRVSPNDDPARHLRLGVEMLEGAMASRGLEGVGRGVVQKDPRFIPPAVRQKLGV